MTALHFACLYSRINTSATRTAAAAPTRYVEALLAAGANPNCRNEVHTPGRDSPAGDIAMIGCHSCSEVHLACCSCPCAPPSRLPA